MSHRCLCLSVLFAAVVILASGGDLSKDLEEAVVETDRAVSALAELFYMRTSIPCKIKCGVILHQDNALYYTTCDLLKPTKSCHHAIQPWLLYLFIFVALVIIWNGIVSCFTCGQRRKVVYVDDKECPMQSVESKNAHDTAVTELNVKESA